MAIEITIGDRGKIHLRSPFAWDTVQRCKNIPGHYWSKKQGVWTFPLTIESCLLLRQEFGASLWISRELAEWFRAERKKRDDMGSLSAATSAELIRVPEVSPRLASAMSSRPYQAVGSRFIADGKSVLIADDPGLGKTLEAIGGVIESGVPGPYLVVCPKTAVQSVWAREIPRWWPEARVVTVPDGREKRDAILDDFAVQERSCGAPKWPASVARTWMVIHPEMILSRKWWVCGEHQSNTKWTRKPTPVLDCGCSKDRKQPTETEHEFPQLFQIDWGAVVFDESQEVLVTLSGTPTQRRLGADLLRVRPDGLRIAASGTPWRSKPHQFWGTLNWLRPKEYPAKWRWIQTYWETGGYTGYEIKDFKESAEPLMWDSLKDIVLRRTKAEVAKDLPPKQYVGSVLDPSDFNSPVGVWLEMTPAQKKAYESMAKTSVAAIEGGELSAIGTLAELTRLRQFASSAGQMSGTEFFPAAPSNKLDYTIELLRQMGYPDHPTGKLVIVSQFVKVLKLFEAEVRKALKMGEGQTCFITGETSGATRERVRVDFNEPVGSRSSHLMFLNIKAGGVAITIDSADDMVIVDEKDADSMTQVEDRLHRVSNPRQVRYHYLRSIGTVDVGTALVNAERDAQGRRLLDGRRGVSYARAVLEASRVA